MSTFTEFLASNSIYVDADGNLYKVVDGVNVIQHQNVFSTNYTEWLKTEVFGSTAVQEYLADAAAQIGFDFNSDFTVELAQNSETGVPYIVGFEDYIELFEDLFVGEKADHTWSIYKKNGDLASTQSRWYFDGFEVPSDNADPVAKDDRWFVSDDTIAVLGADAVLANDSDPDSDPLSITAINGELADGSGIITATTDSGRTVTYDTNTNQFTLTVQGITVGALGSSGLSAEEDSFTYTIDDGNGGTATGTVNLTLIDTKDSNAVGQLDNIDLSQYTAYYQTANEEVPSEAFSYIDAKGGNDSIVGSEGNDILIGGDNDDTLIGGDGDDRLFGNAGADSLVGGDGDDYLDGGTGANILVGDAGDDLLIFRDQNTTENGGGDFDILKFDTGINFNATTANLAGITNIEMVDLENSAADSFGQSGGLGGANRLSASEVISMTDDDNILYILGEAGDSVYLNTGTGWTVGAPAEFQGVMFNTYTSGGATLYIDQDILSANINIA